MTVQLFTGSFIQRGVHLTTWATLANADTGLPQSSAGLPNKVVTVTGTFGAGGTIKMRASNDGTNYFDCVDWQGNAISFTAAGEKSIVTDARYIRPEVTAGDGTTALVCALTESANGA